MNEKQDNQLNIALETSLEQLEKSRELSAGYNVENDSWDLIIKYFGDIGTIESLVNRIKPLSGGYATANANRIFVDEIANLPNVIFVEKPKNLEFAVLNGKRQSCINEVQNDYFQLDNETEPSNEIRLSNEVLQDNETQSDVRRQIGIDEETFENNNVPLFGRGVLIGIIDSGISFTNKAFIDESGNTRILRLWDQQTDRVYTSEDINRALESNNPYGIVNSRDVSGHGTHVAGIAAGNFATDKNNNLGIATRSDLIVVKMSVDNENSFPKTNQLMEGVDFIIKEANILERPVVINISFGNTYGSHDGTSLLSTYLDSVVDSNRAVIVVGTGNEGGSSGHSGGYLEQEPVEVELQISNYERAFGIQIWKNYVDKYNVSLISPSGESTSIFSREGYIYKEQLEDTNINVLYGTPKPYSIFQEIYISLIPKNNYLDAGIWKIKLFPNRIVNGRYDMWLPGQEKINTNTKFLRPDPYTTLTIPSATNKVISVGGYNGRDDTIATFSGRGYTREYNMVKPDIVAPAVNIVSASNNGGITVKSGTSMAAPFVTGAAALLMEWGIVNGNDRFLYGEKVKAYLIRGARPLSSRKEQPNPLAGFGALCLSRSFPE